MSNKAGGREDGWTKDGLTLAKEYKIKILSKFKKRENWKRRK